jgi:hypothetical protein
MATHKDIVRGTVSKAIDSVITIKDTNIRLKGLLGLKMVVDELQYDLSLLIGEQVALIEIEENKKDK